MTTYDYYDEMKSDIIYIIECDYNNDLSEFNSFNDAYETLHDNFWIDDSVTGNASGSYTFNGYKAEENLCHNMDLLVDACNEFGQSIGDAIERGAEYCDVTIRCYLLGSVLSDVLDELNDDYKYWD